MPKLPLFGSVAAVGGAAGIGGLAGESSKPESQIVLTSKTAKPLVMKRCEIYSIVSSNENTVRKESESSFRKQVTNPAHWERMDKECRTKDKIYVANRGGGVYEDKDQKDSGRVVT